MTGFSMPHALATGADAPVRPLIGAAEDASSSRTGVAHCLAIQADAEPGLLERVVGHLSKRGLVPSRMVSSLEGDQLVLDVQVVGLGDGTARHLAQRLRSMPGVDSVLLCLRNGEPTE
jgi:acetolactate synthase regulatory subunit